MHFSSSQDGCLFRAGEYGENIRLGQLLTEIATGSQWANDKNDQFPSDQQWSNQFELMLAWFSGKFTNKYNGQVIRRLSGARRPRDETFAEIIAAYFFEKACGYPVTDWETEFGQGRTADFTTIIPLGTVSTELLVEVKAPSWTGERVGEFRRRIENLEAQRLSAAGTDSASEIDAELERQRASLRRINSEPKYRDDDRTGGAFDFRENLEQLFR